MTAETIVHPVELDKPHAPRVIFESATYRMVLAFDEEEYKSFVGVEVWRGLDLMEHATWERVDLGDSDAFVRQLGLRLYVENPT